MALGAAFPRVTKTELCKNHFVFTMFIYCLLVSVSFGVAAAAHSISADSLLGAISRWTGQALQRLDCRDSALQTVQLPVFGKPEWTRRGAYFVNGQ